jgi:hypothetical protein
LDTGVDVGFARGVPVPPPVAPAALTRRRVIDHGTVHSAGCLAR